MCSKPQSKLERCTENVNVILDIFGGADGGVGFYKLKVRLEQMAQEVDDGKPRAEPILEHLEKTRQLFENLSKG